MLDWAIITKHAEVHKGYFRKYSSSSLFNHGKHAQKYPDLWIVLCSKGYISAPQVLHALCLHFKSPSDNHSLSEKPRNDVAASDFVIIDFLGGCKTVWFLLSHRYRWNHKDYAIYFKLALRFTNLHVIWHPLRAADRHFSLKAEQNVFNWHKHYWNVTKSTPYLSWRTHPSSTVFLFWVRSRDRNKEYECEYDLEWIKVLLLPCYLVITQTLCTII